jgi:hypothetical protein
LYLQRTDCQPFDMCCESVATRIIYQDYLNGRGDRKKTGRRIMAAVERTAGAPAPARVHCHRRRGLAASASTSATGAPGSFSTTTTRNYRNGLF